MPDQVSISTYHEYILEGISALKQGLRIVHLSQTTDNIFEMQNGILGEIYCRYSFLMLSNSLEAAANALIYSAVEEKSFYEESEKLNTLFKFELFCRFLGKQFPRSDNRFARIKELISCRNEFVHPKPRKVAYSFDPESPTITFDIKKTNSREYPHYFSEIKPYHVINGLEDTLAFFSWVCFEVCNLSLSDGVFRLGLNSYSDSGEIDEIEAEYNRQFDKRSFGRKN